MKFTAIKDNLTSGLSIVQRALSTKSVQPILSGIYLSAKNGHLTMVATDTIENAGLRIQCTVPVEVIDHIAAQRQGGIVFVCVRDGGPLPDAETGEPIASDAEQCAFAVRRNVPVKPGHTPITKVHAGAWRPAAGSRLTVYGTTMEELWDSLCAQTIADDIDGSDIDARIAARERATFLESEYAKAKAAHARAKTTEQRNAAYGKMLAIRKELAQLKV